MNECGSIAAVAAARRVMGERRAARRVTKRAEIWDEAARAPFGGARRISPNTIRGRGAAKAIKTARVEAAPAGEHLPVSRAARWRARWRGEMVPLDVASDGRRRQARVGSAGVHGGACVGGDQPFQLPLKPRRRKRCAQRIAAGCGGSAQAASQGRRLRDRFANLPPRRVRLAPGWLQRSSPAAAARWATRSSTMPGKFALITSTGSPPVGWSIPARAGRREKEVGARSSANHNATVIRSRAANWLKAGRRQDPGRRALQAMRGRSCILDANGFRPSVDSRRLRRHGLVGPNRAVRLGWANPLRTRRREGCPHLASDNRSGSSSWNRRCVSEAPRSKWVDKVDGPPARPETVLHEKQSSRRMKVCSDEVFGPEVGGGADDDVEVGIANSRTTPRYRIAGRHTSTNEGSSCIPRARTLDFGGA